MAELVSILIPCHNAAAYVGSAIESASAQTWPKKEIIVVDDGSTDGSGEIIESYRSRGVKIIHQENKGQCAAANRAFYESDGDYIKFFDADDLLAPQTVELQMQRLAGANSAVASAEWGRFYHDDLSTLRLNRENVWRDMQAVDWLVEAWMAARPMMQCALWLIPRPLLQRSGLWDARLSLINDFEFFARVLCHCEQVFFTPDARVYYRSGLQGSLSRTRGRKAVESVANSLIWGTGHLLKHRRDKLARRACANLFQDFIYSYYPEHGDLRKEMARRVQELGGSDFEPDGPPQFHLLRSMMGWRMARRVQRIAGR